MARPFIENSRSNDLSGIIQQWANENHVSYLSGKGQYSIPVRREEEYTVSLEVRDLDDARCQVSLVAAGRRLNGVSDERGLKDLVLRQAPGMSKNVSYGDVGETLDDFKRYAATVQQRDFVPVVIGSRG
jgi:hypothetical protein